MGEREDEQLRIDRYQIIRTLGEGSFGKVKLAYHLATNTKVALKIINRETLVKSDMQGRAEREISYLRLLKHPHIIRLYEVIKSTDDIIMVMEFAGKELFDHIVQKGRMSEAEARRFFQQIISAVDYCHKHKIVHRDLKPENLLLDENLNIKIADFGLSNIMTDGNFLKTSCGSPNYAAPEVISGRLYAGPEVDVWSCGVILYVMLCGRLPFDDERIPELFLKISSGTYTIPDFVSPEAKSLLEKIFVVAPLKRISIEGIINDPWFKVDLPQYLFNFKSDTPSGKLTPDDDVVHLLAQRLGYTATDIVEAINAPSADTPNAVHIRDAYRILVDSKTLVAPGSQEHVDVLERYMEQRGQDSSKQNLNGEGSEDGATTPVISSEIPAAFACESSFAETVAIAGSKIAILPQSLPAYHLAFMKSQGVQMSKRLSPVTVKKSKMRWHFGIRSRSYPLDVMFEIYRALKSLNAEWAQLQDNDLWTIHARWSEDLGSDSPAKLYKMRIQLYQVEQNNYLVDFKYDGLENGSNEVEDTFSAYPFLQFSTKLILRLAVNSQS